ncbi:MAG TPA: 3-oxoadipate enol-lactonase [Actinomycetota bacterium]
MTAARLHHDLAGPQGAPVLVLSNSLGTGTEIWDGQLAALCERFRVLRYDHRGHGRSEVPPGPYTVAELGQDLAALLDGLGIGRVSLCGTSLGGMVGMWLAAHAPQRVERLALLCTSAWLGPPERWTERAALVRSEGTAALVETMAARWFTAPFRRRERERLAAVLATLAATPDEGYAGCCEAIAAMDLRPDLPAIAAPTVVVAALDDQAIPPPHADAIVDGIGRNARRELVSEAAHLAVLEQPERITALLLEHLGG